MPSLNVSPTRSTPVGTATVSIGSTQQSSVRVLSSISRPSRMTAPSATH